MDKTKALEKLLNETATKKEIEILRKALVDGEISIGGDVNRSVVIIGSGNKIELTAEALGILRPEIKIEEPLQVEPPYMGLHYFDMSDADLFFGRELLTHKLLKRIQKESFLAIVGASGSGKSSVARAGLIPTWRKENEQSIIHIITPTAHPLESLAVNLTRDLESVTITSMLMDDMGRDTRSLRLYIKKILAGSGRPKVLLLVDQFEETFTLCKDLAERKMFVENLLSLIDEDNVAHVVITLRADFYHHCAEYEGLRFALEKYQVYIGAMTLDELRQAITMPAKNNGLEFQPGLVDLILSDVGAEPGALPLLSHALLETWKRRQGSILTLQGYINAGGVKKAITQTAESVYDQLSFEDQSVAREIFLRLTEFGAGTQGTRRRVKINELVRTKEQSAIRKVLKTLTDARLVTTEQDSVEVAHEALIREWGTLRKWLEEDHENLRLHRHLTESAQEWERRGHEASELYRGTRLKRLQKWVKEHGDVLSPLEKEFIWASRKRKGSESTQLGLAIFLSVFLALMIYIALMGQLNNYIYRPLDMNGYWVTIPAGKFLMGSSDEQIQIWKKLCSDCDFSAEQPQHWVDLPEYQIGKYEVTNRQYIQCIKAGICFDKPKSGRDEEFHPAVNVSWYGAKIFCEWIGGRLPSEAEWEKAASWNTETQTKFIYPWGNIKPSKALLNFDHSVGAITSVGLYKKGISPYGLFDMAGNVWEWTSSLYKSYPYDATDGREDIGGSSNIRVLRGGAWNDNVNSVHTANRFWGDQRISSNNFGFRCAREVP